MHTTTLIGNVHPQAGGWYFDSPIKVMRGDEEIQLMVRNATFSVRVKTPGDDGVDANWAWQVWLRASTALRGALDAFGLFKGAALEIELVAGSVDDKFTLFVEPSKPNFALVQDARVEANMFAPMRWNVLDNKHLRHAAADLRQALALDDDADFYCYRAIESLRQHYLGDLEDNRSARVRSWEELRNALTVSEDDIKPIREAAMSRRHGGSDVGGYAARSEHVKWTRDLIVRFVETLPIDLDTPPELDI